MISKRDHRTRLENVPQKNSEDLVLFGDVTTKELVVRLCVDSKGFLAFKLSRGMIRVPAIKEINKVDVDTHKSLCQ